MLQAPILTAITAVHSEQKTWEGESYESRTAFFLTQFNDRNGKPFTASVKVSVPKGVEVQPGQKFTLGPDSLFEKGGKLGFSPRLIALPAAAGGAK